MWQALKSNRRVQVAVGAAVLVLALKWLFSDSLLFAMSDAFSQPREGETKSVVLTSAILPLVYQTVVSALAGLGVYAMLGMEWIVGKAKALAGQVSEVAHEATAGETGSLKALTLDLGRAALANDLAAMESIRWRIRKPQAISELSAAYEAGDTEAIDRLKKELDAALASPPSKKKGTASAQ